MSHKYKFDGIIYPERVKFSVGPKLNFHIEMPDFNINGDTEIEFRGSKFTALFTTDNIHTDTSGLETLKNYIEDNVRLVVDIYCYINSYNYDVEVIRVECKKLKVDYTFPVRGEWNINKNTQEVNKEFIKILKVFSNNRYTFLKDALADFRRAIKYPAMTAPHCYRAVETIRQFYFEDPSILDDDSRRNNGWEKMRNTFSLKRTDFDEIEKFAVPGRHGRYLVITYKERERIMNSTRRIIDRLIEEIGKSYN